MAPAAGFSDVPEFGTKSHSRKEIKLTLLGTNDSVTLPVETTTKVIEVKWIMSQKLGIDMEKITFMVKTASSVRNQLDMEEVGRNVVVKGLRSWTKEKNRYPHPMCIVGAGHFGLRQAMSFLKEGIIDFSLFEKLEKVGGMAWVKNANPTSKLQTELGVYHLQYDPDYRAPVGWKTWPSRDELLLHFQRASEEYGIAPHVVLNTAVTEVLPIIDDQSAPFYSPYRQHHEVRTMRTDRREDEEAEQPADALEVVHNFSAVCFFPGGLVEPQRLEYKGEESFLGNIGYGMYDEFDYSKVAGSRVVIVGFGAFAVENVRTCLEHRAGKVTILCRRKNLSMPRVISWLCNQSLYPPSAAMVLDAMKPMYALIPDDPWDYHSVMANSDRSVCSIRQKSRFGISDVYFLASYFGRAAVVVDQIKRIRPDELFLEGGDFLPADHIIKVLGFKGDFSVDRVMGVKEMVGFFVNGDWSRIISAEFPGVDAGKFGGTSFSPKGLSDCDSFSWFINYPRDLEPLFSARVLPRKKLDKASGTPCHIWDPRSGSAVSMYIGGGLIPGLAELGSRYGQFNRDRMLELHPVEKFVDECAEEWQMYYEMFKDPSDDRPCPPYPYSKDFVKELCSQNDQEGEEEVARQTAKAMG